MAVEVGDMVKTPYGTEGKVLELDGQGTTAVVEVGGGMVSRFNVNDLEPYNDDENCPSDLS